jgi:carboxyl-terminal processing protease
VQSVVKLGDGSGLKLTVARYYTPSGRSIQAEGIKPDVMIEDVDTEAYKKAVIKREVRREQDIARHLLGEKEKAAKEVSEKSVESKAQGKEDVSFWWLADNSKNKNKLGPREKLLTEDFQVMQAFNYLRAWKVMEKFGVEVGVPAAAEAKNTETSGSGTNAAPAPAPAPAPTEKAAPSADK